MTRRDLGSSSSELSGISIAFAGHDIVMACVRRLAGDGVYWDRLRVSGRVRGATCAAPRKNRPTSLRGAFPSSRAANLTTTRDAPPSAGPPPQPPWSRRAAAPRAALHRCSREPHGFVSRCCAERRAQPQRDGARSRSIDQHEIRSISKRGLVGRPRGRQSRDCY